MGIAGGCRPALQAFLKKCGSKMNLYISKERGKEMRILRCKRNGCQTTRTLFFFCGMIPLDFKEIFIFFSLVDRILYDSP